MAASTYKILLEHTADGQSSATVLEFPDCQVIAITPQEAISQVPQPTNPWIEFAGIFKDE
jgi:hypothetical protein